MTCEAGDFRIGGYGARHSFLSSFNFACLSATGAPSKGGHEPFQCSRLKVPQLDRIRRSAVLGFELLDGTVGEDVAQYRMQLQRDKSLVRGACTLHIVNQFAQWLAQI